MSTRADVDAGVQAAKSAYPAWRATPAVERARVVFRLKALLEENKEELARSLTREHGKIVAETRGEIQRGIENVEHACGIPTLMMGDNGRASNRPVGQESKVGCGFPRGASVRETVGGWGGGWVRDTAEDGRRRRGSGRFGCLNGSPPDGDDGGPEGGVGRKNPVVSVAVYPRRGDEGTARSVVGEALEIYTKGGRVLRIEAMAHNIRDLRCHLDDSYSPTRAAHDLRKLRCKGLVTKVPRSRRYAADASGLRAMAVLLILRDHVVRPLMAAASRTQSGPLPSEATVLDLRYAAVHKEMRSLFAHLGIAA